MATTPHMGLVLPDDHTSLDTWGLALNTALGVTGNNIDGHDHSPGKGVLVPSAGIGINADLSFGAFALTTAKAITFDPVATSAVTGYANALFVDSTGHNLYFRNASGTNVQLTNGSTINMSLVGGIGGDYSSAGALLSYNDSSKDYLLQQPGSPSRAWAGLETGDIKLFQKATSITNAVTQKSPSALAASYTMTWLTALPGSQVLAQIDSTGQWSASNTLPSNASITLQGTGSYKHGTKTIAQNVFLGLCSKTAGGVSQTDGQAGVALANNTIMWCPVPAIPQHARYVNIAVYFDSASSRNDCTVTLYASSNADPATRTLSSLSIALTPAGTALAKVTGCNVQTTGGRQLWLNISNSATTPVVVAIAVDYDVP